jgi:hypothetical protein
MKSVNHRRDSLSHWFIAFLTALSISLGALPPARALAQGATCPSPYVVQKGDSWYKIATKCGVTFEDLRAQNQDLWQRRGRAIQVGDRLVTRVAGQGVPIFLSRWGAGSLEQILSPTDETVTCSQIAVVMAELISGQNAYLYFEGTSADLEPILDPESYLLWLDNGSATFGNGWAFRVDDGSRVCPKLAGQLRAIAQSAGGGSIPANSPQMTVEAYYDLIDRGVRNGDLSAAYALFSRARQARQSYVAWSRLYAATNAVTLEFARAVSQTPNRAVVHADVVTRDIVNQTLVDIRYDVVINLLFENGGWRLDTATSTEQSRTTVQGTGSACVSAPVPHLMVGEGAVLVDSVANRIRSAPSASSQSIGSIQPGETVTVLDGPRCDAVKGWNYWQIETAAGVVGWTVEGERGIYWLAPVDTQQDSGQMRQIALRSACGKMQQVTSADSVTLQAFWGTKGADLAEMSNDIVMIELVLDGEVLESTRSPLLLSASDVPCGTSLAGSSWLVESAYVGELAPGSHTVNVRYTFAEQISDGYDANRDGRLDSYGPGGDWLMVTTEYTLVVRP